MSIEYAVRVYRTKILGKHDSTLFRERFATKMIADQVIRDIDKMTAHILEPFTIFPPIFTQSSENIILKFSESVYIIALQSGPMIPILIGSAQIALDDICALYKDRSEKTLITKQSASFLLV